MLPSQMRDDGCSWEGLEELRRVMVMVDGEVLESGLAEELKREK